MSSYMVTDGFQQTKHGLIRRRAELVAEIEALQSQAAQKVADLHALEACIRIFDPSMDVEDLPSRRIPPPYAAFRGEMARFFLTTLREHPGGLTTYDLALCIMRSRQMNVHDRAAVTLIQKRTGHSLRGMRDKGFVISEKADASGMLRWRLSIKGQRGGPLGGWRNGSGPTVMC